MSTTCEVAPLFFVIIATAGFWLCGVLFNMARTLRRDNLTVPQMWARLPEYLLRHCQIYFCLVAFFLLMHAGCLIGAALEREKRKVKS